MSRAFTREDAGGDALAGIGDRPVSPHRNLVTPEGMAAMDAQLVRLREAIAAADPAAQAEHLAKLSRDLRYWTARRETAEPSVPPEESEVVRFGMAVTVADEEGTTRRWRIVGEDEADAAQGSISHASPMAQALFGKRVGDVSIVNGKEWEIVALG